jgi:hypothetical protein
MRIKEFILCGLKAASKRVKESQKRKIQTFQDSNVFNIMKYLVMVELLEYLQSGA